MNTHTHTTLDRYLIDREVPAQVRELVPPRRTVISPLPLVHPVDARAIQKALFPAFGLDEYVDCATCEMASRPVPHCFRTSEVAALTQLYENWLPDILARILPEIAPPLQSYNKISRLGWPVLSVPDRKQEWLDAYFPHILSDGVKGWEDSFITIGIRLQTEAASKERDFLFLSETGVYEKTIGRKEKQVETKLHGLVTAARTRNVFNLPVPNLFKQTLDTAIHNAYLKYPLFHHNMYAGGLVSGETRPFYALDVKHFERHTAEAARARGALLGGLYAEITKLFASIPFLVPQDDWNGFAFLFPNRAAGWSEQFASGDSAVTTVQKEIFLALYSEYFARQRGLSRKDALSLTLAGGDTSLTILNYGDDNFLFGDPAEIASAVEFLGSYLSVEQEDPPKFLGFQFVEQPRRRFELGLSSYLLKTYLPERGVNTVFRSFPAYGWMLKRETYAKIGAPIIAAEIFPAENDALDSIGGVPWSDIIGVAIAERQRMNMLTSSFFRDPRVLLEKEWMLTDAEKVASGMFIGYTPEQTAPMIKRLLGQEWHALLKF